jgi:hypothetical protein
MVKMKNQCYTHWSLFFAAIKFGRKNLIWMEKFFFTLISIFFCCGLISPGFSSSVKNLHCKSGDHSPTL